MRLNLCHIFPSSLFLLISCLFSTCYADVWDPSEDPYLDAVTNIPECGLECVLQLTPGLNSSCISADSTDTCFCEDDIGHYIDVLNCVQDRCSTEESIGEWSKSLALTIR